MKPQTQRQINARRYALDPVYGKPPRWGKLYGKYFPTHTCPASRHTKIIADDILRNPQSPVRQMLMDAGYEPDHWASSLELTVEMLWEERALLAKHAPKFVEARNESHRRRIERRLAKREAAQGIAAGTDETAQPVRPEGQEPGPATQDAPNQSQPASGPTPPPVTGPAPSPVVKEAHTGNGDEG